MTDATNRPPDEPRRNHGPTDPDRWAGLDDPREAVPPPAIRLSLGERMVLLVTRPWQAMQVVAEQPAVMIALGAIFLLMALYTAVNIHVIVPEQTEWQIQHAPVDHIAGLEQQIDLFSDPPVWLRLAGGLGSGFSVAVFAVLVPGLLLHLFLRLSEGQGSMRQTLGVVAWAGLIPYGIRTLIGWIIIVSTDSSRLAGVTLASVLPDPNPQSVAYMAANLYGDPFMYWMLWVMVLGIMQAHRLVFGRALAVAAATYVLLSAIPIGFSLLNQVLAGR